MKINNTQEKNFFDCVQGLRQGKRRHFVLILSGDWWVATLYTFNKDHSLDVALAVQGR